MDYTPLQSTLQHKSDGELQFKRNIKPTTMELWSIQSKQQSSHPI